MLNQNLMQGHCDTCEKRNRGKRAMCSVLLTMEGLKKECWAWTDDPDWWSKTQVAGELYKRRRMERGLRD